MSLVTISDVHVFDLDEEALVGFQLDQPDTGSSSDVHSIAFEGWALGRNLPVAGLDVSPGPGLEGILLPVGLPTPDLADAHPDVPWAGRRSGFRVRMSVLGLPPEFDLHLSVFLRDHRRIPVARIRGERKAGVVADPSGMQPIVVTTMGRTGSQLVTNMLGRHPEIVIYPLWVMETKIASYWADVFSALAGPRSYLQPVSSVIRGPRWWLGETQPHDEQLDDRPLLDWLGASQVGEVGRFCGERINAFYERLVEPEDQRPQYFLEKCLPKWPAYAQVLREIYPGIREIVLVRDPRDVLCSIFAYNRRLGAQLFGRELAKSDEEYVRGFIANQLRMLTTGWRERSDWAYLLRYEDLILEPQETLHSLLAYLDLDSGGNITDSLLTALMPSDGGEHPHGTSSSARDSIGRWQQELDPTLQVVCEEVFAEALDTFNYLPAGATSG